MMNERSEETINNYKARIIGYALELFRQRGIKDVTMSDISQHLKISKRTIYEIYDSKEQLLLDCLEHQDRLNRQRYEELRKSCSNVLEFILTIFGNYFQYAHEINPRLYQDLLQYPIATEHLNQNRKRDMGDALRFLQQGIDEGVFVPGLDYSVIYQFITRLMEYVIKDETLTNYSIKELVRNTILIYVRGFTTEKGRQIMNDFLTKNDLLR